MTSTEFTVHSTSISEVPLDIYMTCAEPSSLEVL